MQQAVILFTGIIREHPFPFLLLPMGAMDQSETALRLMPRLSIYQIDICQVLSIGLGDDMWQQPTMVKEHRRLYH